MAAVVRIKRRLEDEPLEALILNCKRQKRNPCGNDIPSVTPELSSTVLTLAGTIQENENVLKHIGKLDEIKENYKTHSVDMKQKLRNAHKEKSKTNRYKIIHCLRSQNVETSETSTDHKSSITANAHIMILDLEAEIKEKSTGEDSKTGGKYVYDLYYTSSDYFGDAELEEQEHISIFPLKDPLFFSPSEDQLDSDLDSEDSNAENNWRNDYPDEDDMFSINEDDMVDAIKNIDLEDDLLSSDDGEEGFIYSVDCEAIAFEEDIDETDVHRYGERYARFKAKYKMQADEPNHDHDLYYGDIEEEEAEDSYNYY